MSWSYVNARWLFHVFSFIDLSFSFYCSGHPRDLHSFPTRRSSDLNPYKDLPFVMFRSIPVPGRLHGASIVERSEEHTSELQSHSDIVCRLLLEKKKASHGTSSAQPLSSTRRW